MFTARNSHKKIPEAKTSWSPKFLEPEIATKIFLEPKIPRARNSNKKIQRARNFWSQNFLEPEIPIKNPYSQKFPQKYF